jgi:hypothetical protein
MGRDREVKPLVAMWSTICSGDPGVHGIVPPGWAQRLLVVKKAADPFDKGLNLPFNWILMLVTRSGWLHGYPMTFWKSSSCCRVVFRGTRIAPDVANMVTVLAVKPDD